MDAWYEPRFLAPGLKQTLCDGCGGMTELDHPRGVEKMLKRYVPSFVICRHCFFFYLVEHDFQCILCDKPIECGFYSIHPYCAAHNAIQFNVFVGRRLCAPANLPWKPPPFMRRADDKPLELHQHETLTSLDHHPHVLPEHSKYGQ